MTEIVNTAFTFFHNNQTLVTITGFSFVSFLIAAWLARNATQIAKQEQAEWKMVLASRNNFIAELEGQKSNLATKVASITNDKSLLETTYNEAKQDATEAQLALLSAQSMIGPLQGNEKQLTTQVEHLKKENAETKTALAETQEALTQTQAAAKTAKRMAQDLQAQMDLAVEAATLRAEKKAREEMTSMLVVLQTQVDALTQEKISNLEAQLFQAQSLLPHSPEDQFEAIDPADQKDSDTSQPATGHPTE